jgi:hypothetical protein
MSVSLDVLATYTYKEIVFVVVMLNFVEVVYLLGAV